MKNLLHCKKINYRDLQTKKHRKVVRKGFGKLDVAYTILFFAIVLSVGIEVKHQPVKLPQIALAQETTYISPLAKVEAFRLSPTPTLTPTPVRDDRQTQIYKLIQQTFGNYTPRAMQLLSCENSALDPNITNTAGNTPEGSMDIGVFQINNYWNDIGNVELLKDPQVNIAVAWHKFVASGYSFNQWTCGKRMGL